MNTVSAAPCVPGLAGCGGEARFPCRRIYCVGRNYAARAREMGFTGREDPFFFCKPADAIVNVPDGQTGTMPYPPKTADLQHEIELVAALGQGGRDLSVEQAERCVWGYAIGLDMTRRDLQGAAKKQGRPWEVGKAFDFSAPIGPLHARAHVGSLDSGAIALSVNGIPNQAGDLSDLILSVAESLPSLSGLFDRKSVVLG